ncbi:MAG: HAD-IA family hydrolase [Candidatus Gracilibacteria bacterium]|nr:HAD-IA family hydrolase [Candidatus Gracilibacteria bacterium]
MKKYLIFDFDGTLICSTNKIIDVIGNYFFKNYPDLEDTARYYLQNSQGMSLLEQMKTVFDNKITAEKVTKELYILLNTLRNKVSFIPGVQKKIRKLSKKYRLFLTTGSSTRFAKETLKDGSIEDCFELIYGSDEVLKGKDHIDIFKEYTQDENFYKNSLYIGDGDMDKLFAQESGIDFIRVGTRGTSDEVKISSVTYIDNILEKYN